MLIILKLFLEFFNMSVCDWLFPLTLIVINPIHFAAHGKVLLFVGEYSIIHMYLYISNSSFIYPFDEHLEWFNILVIVNTAVNMTIKESLSFADFIYLGIVLASFYRLVSFGKKKP